MSGTVYSFTDGLGRRLFVYRDEDGEPILELTDVGGIAIAFKLDRQDKQQLQNALW